MALTGKRSAKYLLGLGVISPKIRISRECSAKLFDTA
jgi:hypothetical protein